MRLSRLEQETVILFNEEEKTASVYTHNGALRRKLAALATERPGECVLVRDGAAAEYTVPKKWVRINPTRILSEAQRAASKAGLEKARFSSKLPPHEGI